MWFDGLRVAALSRTENFGTAPIGSIQLGENATGRVYDIFFDDVAVRPICIGSCPATAPAQTAQQAEPQEPTQAPSQASSPTPTSTSTAARNRHRQQCRRPRRQHRQTPSCTDLHANGYTGANVDSSAADEHLHPDLDQARRERTQSVSLCAF